MAFRKGGLLSRQGKCYYNGAEIEKSEPVELSGCSVNPGGSFIQATKTLRGKALRPLCSLLSMIKSLEIPLDIMINLFNAFVCSILLYVSETWGFTSAIMCDRVQRKFCKWMLNVKQSTHNLAICSELGLHPMFIERLRILNESGNIILHTVYMKMVEDMSKGAINWLSKVKNLLEFNGLAEIWMYPDPYSVITLLPFWDRDTWTHTFQTGERKWKPAPRCLGSETLQLVTNQLLIFIKFQIGNIDTILQNSDYHLTPYSLRLDDIRVCQSVHFVITKKTQTHTWYFIHLYRSYRFEMLNGWYTSQRRKNRKTTPSDNFEHHDVKRCL